MATRCCYLTRSVLTAATNRSITTTIAAAASAAVSRSYANVVRPSVSSFLFHLVTTESRRRCIAPLFSTSATGGFASRLLTTSSGDNDSNLKETNCLGDLPGCDFKHWLVVMYEPDGDPTRDVIIDNYIKTLAKIVGSEDEARKKIYSVYTRCSYCFGALVSEELSNKLRELPMVQFVFPDSYSDVKNKTYGGEPFINGQAVLYDMKYHSKYEEAFQQAKFRNFKKMAQRNNGANVQSQDGTPGVLPLKGHQKKKSNEWGLFMDAVIHYGRKYKSVAEMYHRFVIFKNKLKRMDEFNRSKNGCRSPMNRYFDLTLEEFRAQNHLLKKSEMDHEMEEQGLFGKSENLYLL